VQSVKHSLKVANGEGLLRQRVNQFLNMCRNTPHAMTKCPPATLMLGRQLWTMFDLLRPEETRRVVERRQERQMDRRAEHAKLRIFQKDEVVPVRNRGGNGFRHQFQPRLNHCPTMWRQEMSWFGVDMQINYWQHPIKEQKHQMWKWRHPIVPVAGP